MNQKIDDKPRTTFKKKTLNQKYQAAQKKTRKYAELNGLRKDALRQYGAFCEWLLKEGRVTKDEMRPFFKRKEEVKRGLRH